MLGRARAPDSGGCLRFHVIHAPAKFRHKGTKVLFGEIMACRLRARGSEPPEGANGKGQGVAIRPSVPPPPVPEGSRAQSAGALG